MLRIFAPAKVNLFLHVLGKRADGYHDLDSLVAFADVGDEIFLEDADALSLKIDGPFADVLSSPVLTGDVPSAAKGEGGGGATTDSPPPASLRSVASPASGGGVMDNLVLRAARGMAEIAGRPMPRAITLVKNLPVASGIGGGSADAGATMRGLLQQWHSENIRLADFMALAERLGADVPVCFRGMPALISGRGDDLDFVDLPGLELVLVNPGVAVSTAEVFARLNAPPAVRDAEAELPDWLPPRGDTEAISARALLQRLEETRNDLETPAREIAPVIGDVLAALRGAGAGLARLSGSGATCFGIFADGAAAKAAAEAIGRAHPQWWVKAARTLN